jgi:hypothetical protein
VVDKFQAVVNESHKAENNFKAVVNEFPMVGHELRVVVNHFTFHSAYHTSFFSFSRRPFNECSKNIRLSEN